MPNTTKWSHFAAIEAVTRSFLGFVFGVCRRRAFFVSLAHLQHFLIRLRDSIMNKLCTGILTVSAYICEVAVRYGIAVEFANKIFIKKG